MSEIVLDKSYLDSATTAEVRRLCAEHTVMLPDVLFYELMTTRAESRRSCFAKLPPADNPLLLIPNVGTLLRQEMEERRPSVPLSSRKVKLEYRFNQRLADGSFVFEGEVQRTIEEQRQTAMGDAAAFLDRALIVGGFFPELENATHADLDRLLAACRQKVATDPSFVRCVYASFLEEDCAPPKAVDPQALDERWAWFRYVQCELLAALRILGRYRGRIPEQAGTRFRERIEHSMHDVQYVVHGSLAGGLATRDQAVIDDFLAVRPSGLVIQ